MCSAKEIKEAIDRAESLLRDSRYIITMSSNFAKKLVDSKINERDFPSNIFVNIDDRCEDDKAYIFKGEMRDNLLKMYDDGLMKLFTFNQLKNIFDSGGDPHGRF